VDWGGQVHPEGVSEIESLWSVLIGLRFRLYPQTLPRLGRGHPSPHTNHTVNPTLFDLATPLVGVYCGLLDILEVEQAQQFFIQQRTHRGRCTSDRYYYNIWCIIRRPGAPAPAAAGDVTSRRDKPAAAVTTVWGG